MPANPRKIDDGQAARLREAASGLSTTIGMVSPDGFQALYRPERDGYPAVWSVVLMKSKHVSVGGFGPTLWAALFDAITKVDGLSADARGKVRA